MQKLINGLAIASFLVSAGVVAGGVYVYTNKDNIKENIKTELTDAVKDLFSGSQLGSTLVGGSDEAPGSDINLPVVPFW